MTQDNNDWKRHPDLYLPDGTIVLLADTTVFRVYGGLLAKRSDVFQGLMESSQYLPADGEVYDGCPLVQLQDDAKDVAHFLNATMGGQPMPYPIASAILRLSSKYMVQSLRQQAIRHFGRIIPPSYDELNKVEKYSQVFGTNPSDRPHPFQLLSLFRECQLAWYLPWQYYVVCAYGIEELVEGAIMSNGKKIHLDAFDSQVAILGWNTLCTMSRNIRKLTIVSSAQKCQAKSPCNDTMRLVWMGQAAGPIDSEALSQWDWLASLTGKTITWRPCKACTQVWLMSERDARAAVWLKLPSIFKLPDWESLKREEES
ncbi:hypothetical protein Clacol_004197 [Clathrus columnatus]|uniref:BTB domain-containing protein n=1 Tax=Clathrus columnatus TaxID=1419009 RepID=A0AAV5A8W4_9AGAM|nr:hypothetical protein Clacol_004197 [Clathrus columnatus]